MNDIKLSNDHNGAPAKMVVENQWPFYMYGQSFMKKKYQVATDNVVQKRWYDTAQLATIAWNEGHYGRD